MWHFLYFLVLAILLLILNFLLREEKKERDNISQGKANKLWLLKEKRRYIRFPEEINISYDVLHKPSTRISSVTKDISQRGLSLITYERLNKNDRLDLSLKIPGEVKPLTLIGEVVWERDLKNHDKDGKRLFYVGVKVKKIKPDSKTMLNKYLEFLKEKKR